MTKAAVIVLADTETHGDLARVVNAMMTAKEFAEARKMWNSCSTAREHSGWACSPTQITGAIAYSSRSMASSPEHAHSAPPPSTQKTGPSG